MSKMQYRSDIHGELAMGTHAGETRTEHGAHLARIDTIIRRWQRGEISIAAKRQQMADENNSYELLTAGAQTALEAWREGAWSAERADSLDNARRALRRGQEAYADIMRSAR